MCSVWCPGCVEKREKSIAKGLTVDLPFAILDLEVEVNLNRKGEQDELCGGT